MAATKKKQSRSRELRTILVVDDEPDILESVRGILEAHTPRFRVLTCSSAHEAMRVMEREPVDLVVSDWRMPGTDGITFLKHAKQVAPEVPRILFTAYPRRNVAARAVEDAAIKFYLVKTIDPATFVKTLESAMDDTQPSVQISDIDSMFPSGSGFGTPS
jgi:two-component system response regulator HupR/HoxA